MNAYFYWGRLKTFDLCGATQNERLHVVEAHSGISGKGPLGARPGLLLHSGMSSEDPILAAAGDESLGAARVYAFNLNTVVLLPPLESSMKSSNMTTEIMRAATSADHGVKFCFSIEVGEKLRREKFEWRKIKKGEDNGTKSGGFKLVRLSNGSQMAQSNSGNIGNNGSSSKEPSSLSPEENDGETVAMLAWTMSWFGSRHAFSLELTGSGKLGILGERWALMSVITALRLLVLHVSGRAHKGVIGIGEKVRGNNTVD